MMFSYLPAASYRRRLPRGLHLLGIGWVWIACATAVPGRDPQQQALQQQAPQQRAPQQQAPQQQAPQQRARVPVPGEVVRSIAIRVTAGQPRLVVAARVVEESVHSEDAEESNSSTSAESPPEIVDYFKRNAQQHLADIDCLCELSQRQKDKLELAAMGDMSRLVRELREVRRKYSGTALHNQHRNLTVLNDVAVINTHLGEGVLRNDSMFLMVLKSLLTSTQWSQLAAAKFAQLTSTWPIELSDDQRQQLWQLVLHSRESPPLLWFPKHCRALIAELSQPELVSLVGESKANTLRRWQPR